MKTRLRLAAAGLLCAGLLAQSAVAAVITFDDLDTSAGDLALDALSPYAGLTWANFSAYTTTPGFDGFNNGIVSPDNAAYSGGELFVSSVVPVVGSISSATSFDFGSAHLGAGYYDNLLVTVKGLRGGSVIYSQDVTLGTGGASLFNFGFTNVDTLQFSASTGTTTADPFGCGVFNCTQFTIDNITVVASSVPEPSILAMFAAGGVLCLARRRRQLAKNAAAI